MGELLTYEWISETIKLDERIKQCLVDFADQTRRHPLALQGVSTRSLVLADLPRCRPGLGSGTSICCTCRCGTLAPHIFAHRLMMGAASDSAMDVVVECLKEPMETCARKVYR